MTDLQRGSEFAGYRIDEIAGEGGMGVVYRATHLTLEIPVAVKVIRPELAKDAGFRERFKRESRLAASIDHPNVLPVHHAGEHDGLLYITMRYVQGTDLRALIETEGKIDKSRAAGLVNQVAAALDAAHASDLVHRDVKPANVLIEPRPGGDRAFLTDFGLTRQASSQSGLTRTGQWVGTLDYVAPEQIEGKKVDARADVYALGCMLYEILSGSIPFVRESEVATMYAHLNEDPPPLADRDSSMAQLDVVIRRAMAKDPADRFQTASAFGEATIAALGSAAAPPPLPAHGETVASQPVSKPETVTSDSPSQRTALSPPASPPAPPVTPPPAPLATPPSTPAPATRDTAKPQRRRWPLYAAGGGLAALAIIVGVLLGTGALGGDDPASDSDDDSAQLEASAQGVMEDFESAFNDEGLAGIEALLADDAEYLYPGFDSTSPATEYRDLFAALEVRDYRLDVKTVETAPDSVTIDALYEYDADGPLSGTVSMVLAPDEASGELKIAEIRPIPDVYVLFDNTDPPTTYSATASVGSRKVAADTFELGQKADDIPLRLPIDPGAESAFNSDVEFTVDAKGEDANGRFRESISVGYPWAS
ncbi:MAG TPA: serine/threonine-protein kinase [Solirubrobacterales bacterium]|nr:serine/threonine-protein kinase [Solirubrobacterales bacterium]